MSSIVLKKSSVVDKVPLATDLVYGELALNYADGKLYYKKADNNIDFFSAGAGTGAGGTTTVSTTSPPTPAVGDTWINSTTGAKYDYIDDGDSTQWVQLDAQVVISSGATAAPSIYSGEYQLTGTTTDSTETEIFVDGISNSRILVPINKTVYYTADIVCRRTDASGDYAAFYIKGVATNLSGTVSDVGLVYEVNVVKTDAAFAVDFRADNTNDSVNLYVTGNTGKTLQWKCAVTALEV